ncbi:RAMP superfamily CRISPR-associated protein [Candidatus Viridilinea mediisalina]|uniref:CRISPR type III-associated protein domain-containing protein n=1 Tax=Candidatus Viridilinea mediisalina TaxID=2024553 RepID=A0A2A6RGG5_9CHLR|nr:RAMP superfamily CRISPR-associated protein [Candidatus Viridilinea mediisalina]PDW01976.1 hypothetical protein CJ255_16330 [Candidatus Viridilinea mediisalina]
MKQAYQAQWHASREVATRLVVSGTLTLTSPAHLGNGDRGAHVDLPILRDALEDLPLLQGSSLAGALRNYLLAYEQGFYKAEERGAKNLAELLFGGVKGDPEGEQSPLIIDDALADFTLAEIRDGVRIDGKTRTAQKDFKYDLEVLPPGTSFPLRFELLLPKEGNQATALREALALALDGLQRGEIALGARKSRGYGRCAVATWQVVEYNLRRSPEDLLAWLSAEHPEWGYQPAQVHNSLGVHAQREDKRKIFRIEASFELATPLLIRSAEPLHDGDHQPDVVQLRDGTGQPIISGTSLAGVLRARAKRILTTVAAGQEEAILNSLFGRDMDKRRANEQPSASRLIVHEAQIEGGRTLVQNRVAIDRFTGGAYDTALFSEAPQVGGTVTLTLSIHNPSEADKGLLLLLLKDLWTGDLPIGGTSSVGRGRLRGCKATIHDAGQEWEIVSDEGQLKLPTEARTVFESYVVALQKPKERSSEA